MLLYIWHICGPWEGHHGILDKSNLWELENIAKFKVFSINQMYVALFVAYVDLGKDTTEYWINQLYGN